MRKYELITSFDVFCKVDFVKTQNSRGAVDSADFDQFYQPVQLAETKWLITFSLGFILSKCAQNER